MDYLIFYFILYIIYLINLYIVEMNILIIIFYL